MSAGRSAGGPVRLRAPGWLVAILGWIAAGACSPGSPAPERGRPHVGDEHGGGRGGAAGGGPTRTLIHRPLLGTSIQNLLLDPFVTADRSWGHFIALALPITGSDIQIVPVQRAFVSFSPAGISAPVAGLRAPVSVSPAAAMIQVVAPFPGGSDPLTADVWVSGGDLAGDPVDFAAAAGSIEVDLLPNDEPARVVALVDQRDHVRFGDREWVRLALPAPLALPRGGWFSIVVADPGTSLQVQAPEVAPTGLIGPAPAPVAEARRAHHRAALRAYADVLRRLR